MIKLRILECAMIQKKFYYLNDSVYYVMKKRRTFSNMHHLVTCDCQPIRWLTRNTPSRFLWRVVTVCFFISRHVYQEIAAVRLLQGVGLHRNFLSKIVLRNTLAVREERLSREDSGNIRERRHEMQHLRRRGVFKNRLDRNGRSKRKHR